ncbi:MAG: translation initiation factor 2 subunit 1 [archaeon GW2011_AR18]|nr:MAG: translation initiation factor 2 subunit 1 [archaeon GW2011_AR18]
MFYKKKGKPEIDEIVICTVKRVLYHSVFVNIDEYENAEGMIHISEIAPGRIRNIRDYVVEEKKVVCKVLNITEKGDLDLSLRRVSTTQMVNKLNDYKKEEKAEKLLEQIGKELNFNLKKVYEDIGIKAIERYGSLNNLFNAILEKGKDAVTELKGNEKLSEQIYKVVKEKIKPIQITVSYILNIRSYAENGVDTVRNILTDAEKQGTEIMYLGAPKYKISTTSTDVKKADTLLKKIIEKIEESSKRLSIEFSYAKNG